MGSIISFDPKQSAPQGNRLGARLPEWILGLTILLAGTWRFSLDYWIVLGMLIGFVGVPGWCLIELIFPRLEWDALRRICLAFACGLVFLCVWFLVRSYFMESGSVGGTAAALAGTIGLLMACAFFRMMSARRRFRVPDLGALPRMPLVCGLILSLLLLFNEHSLLLTSDSLAYIPKMQVWAEKAQFSEERFESVLDFLGRTRLYRSAIQPFFLAFGKVTASVQYLILVSLWAPCILWSFYAFARSLHPNRTFGTLAVLFCMVHFGGVWFNWIHSNYSWLTAWMVYFTATALILEPGGEQPWKKRIPAGFLLASTFLIHGSLFGVALASMGLYLVARWLWIHRGSRIAGIAGLLLGLLVVGSYLAYLLHITGFSVPWLKQWVLFDKGTPIRELARPFGAGYVVDPVSVPIRFLGLWGGLALAAAPLVIWRYRDTLSMDTRVFLVSNLYGPLLILFNPILVTALVDLTGGRWAGLDRLCFVIPYIPVLALLAWYSMSRRTPGVGFLSRRLLTGLILLMIVAAGFSVIVYRSLMLMPMDLGKRLQPAWISWTGFDKGPIRYDHTALMHTLFFIQREAPPSAKIVTDPITAELLPLYVSNPTTEYWRLGFMEKDMLKSRNVKILSPLWSIRKTLRELDRMGARYVLVNNSMDGAMMEHYFGSLLGTGSNPFDVAKFLEHPRMFRLVYRENEVYLFERIRPVESRGSPVKWDVSMEVRPGRSGTDR